MARSTRAISTSSSAIPTSIRDARVPSRFDTPCRRELEGVSPCSGVRCVAPSRIPVSGRSTPRSRMQQGIQVMKPLHSLVLTVASVWPGRPCIRLGPMNRRSPSDRPFTRPLFNRFPWAASNLRAGSQAARAPGRRTERAPRRVLARHQGQRLDRRQGRGLGARPLLARRHRPAGLPARRPCAQGQGQDVRRLHPRAPAPRRLARADRRHGRSTSPMTPGRCSPCSRRSPNTRRPPATRASSPRC